MEFFEWYSEWHVFFVMMALVVTSLGILYLITFSSENEKSNPDEIIESDKVSQNLSEESDNFNVVRQLTVINCIQGDVLFQMTGKLSVYADTADNQLEVVVEDENGKYQKHFIGLNDNVTYTIEQKQYEDVSNYKYTLNFNPKMWIPVDVKAIE